MDKMFETASFHIVKPCNMKCKFCYATFQDMNLIKQLSYPDACSIINKLYNAGVDKITFAGGEPLLYKHIEAVIKYAKSIGMTTSIITNGSLLTDEFLDQMVGHLDWVGVSIDSMNYKTNELIGRVSTKPLKRSYTMAGLLMRIQELGYKLKINTVVNSFNWYADLNDLIDEFQPERWKVFQALRVEGQNDEHFNEIKVTDKQFKSFLETHKHQKALVPEDNEAMTGSYLLIDPQGRLFENSAGKHTYSDKLQDNDIDHCLSQINLNREMFVARGGIYEW